MLGYDAILPPNVDAQPGLLFRLATEIDDGTVEELPSLAFETGVIEIEFKRCADLSLDADPSQNLGTLGISLRDVEICNLESTALLHRQRRWGREIGQRFPLPQGRGCIMVCACEQQRGQAISDGPVCKYASM